MIETISVIVGVIKMIDLIYPLKGLKSEKEKAIISLDRVVADRSKIACYITISNVGDKPFNVIDIFFEQKERKFHGLAVRESVADLYDKGGNFTLKADMTSLSFECEHEDEFCNLDAFDFTEFLQPQQAESGWIIFPMKPKDIFFTSLGIRISGEIEIFKTYE